MRTTKNRALCRTLLTVSILFSTGPAPANQTAASYAGQEQRSIKALSEDEIKGFLSGSGAGYARAAELNSYPGPMHVIELAERLRLSEAQLAAMRELMHSHKAEARQLGEEVVQLERELDALFASRSATTEAVQTKAREAGIALARYRASHLTTHITATRLLEPAQVERYNNLRGYRGGAGYPVGNHHH